MKSKVPSPPSVQGRILKRVRAHGRGGVFTPRDFLDLVGRAAIDQALARLAKGGDLRRLARGLYDFPKIHAKLGALSAQLDDVAKAPLAQETGSLLQINGARAANALGLVTQVPAQNLYLTDGPPRRILLGRRMIDLRRASPKHLIAPGSPAGSVVQALRHLGPSRAPDVVRAASRNLSSGPSPFISCKRRPAEERAALFGETAVARGLADAIVEKDFWARWTLKRLFHLPRTDAPRSRAQGRNLSVQGLQRHPPLLGRHRHLSRPRRAGL